MPKNGCSMALLEFMKGTSLDAQPYFELHKYFPSKFIYDLFSQIQFIVMMCVGVRFSVSPSKPKNLPGYSRKRKCF